MTAAQKIEALLKMVDFPQAQKDQVLANLDKLDLNLTIIKLRQMVGCDDDPRFTTAYHS